MLSKITADDMRAVYTDELKRSKRQAAYAMQVIRAVLRWHGTRVAGNPLDRDMVWRDRDCRDRPLANYRSWPILLKSSIFARSRNSHDC